MYEQANAALKTLFGPVRMQDLEYGYLPIAEEDAEMLVYVERNWRLDYERMGR